MNVREAMRFHYKEKTAGIIILEYPPSARHIFMGNKWTYLALPYQYMLLSYRRPGPGWLFFPMWLLDIRLAWRKSPLKQLTDPLAGCGLPMGQHFSSFCHGNFKNIPHLTVGGWLNYIVGWFWASSFYAAYESPVAGMSIDQWHKWSKEDPAFILRMGWQETKPLKEILDNMGWTEVPASSKLYPYRGPDHDKIHCHQP
jgi:hypothetical protein